MKRLGRWCGILLAVAAATSAASAADRRFPRPQSLEPAISFWRAVFSRYSEQQEVIHDDWYLDRVYEVLDYRGLADPDGELSAEDERIRANEVRSEKERIREILLMLDRKGPNAPGLTAEEQRIAAMFAKLPGPDRYRQAAERVRSQSGLRKRFGAGIARWRGYREEMTEIFRRHGLPTELTVMPLFESCFNLAAYSKVGAAGVWQFMPATGRLYMRVNAVIDERRDPIRSTEAAAQHLRRDYELLGSWPVAITAYNHGRGGMARATSELGTDDIGTIVKEYKGKTFGFASRNFYAEFLAALDVVARADHLWEDLPSKEAPEGREVMLRRSMRLNEAARMSGVPRDHLIAMNPALQPMVIRNRSSIPEGYRLRVPESTSDARIAMLQPGMASRVAIPQDPEFVIHTVKRGQTLASIADRYDTNVRTLQGLNGLRKARSLRVGQRLKVPPQ
jgi:membrane-bound lytic murein transglycosylase D